MIAFIPKEGVYIKRKKRMRDDDTHYHTIIFAFGTISKEEADKVMLRLNKMLTELTEEIKNV